LGKVKISRTHDMGATEHVTYCFISFYSTKPVTVKLPNDSHITTNYAGTI